MDIQQILTAISTVGFPIVMCCICCWYVKYQNDQHKEETEKLSAAIHNNTLVMTKLIDKLGKEDEE